MPFNCNPIFNNALACHRAGQLQQAAKLYRQILNIDRDHAQASNNLGAIFMTLAV
jgi:Flp pilus assembly protein TadD